MPTTFNRKEHSWKAEIDFQKFSSHTHWFLAHRETKFKNGFANLILNSSTFDANSPVVGKCIFSFSLKYTSLKIVFFSQLNSS